MKCFLLLLLNLPSICLAQTISLESHQLTVETPFKGREFHYVDSILHLSVISIELVKLLPVCDDKDNCYTASCIREVFNHQQQLTDSVDYFDSYFAGVITQHIDFLSAKKVEPSDCPFFLKQLLQPEIVTNNTTSLICYEPRHAVIFYNEKKEIIAVHEICFQCNKSTVGIYANRLHDLSAHAFKPLFKKYGLYE